MAKYKPSGLHGDVFTSHKSDEPFSNPKVRCTGASSLMSKTSFPLHASIKRTKKMLLHETNYIIRCRSVRPNQLSIYRRNAVQAVVIPDTSPGIVNIVNIESFCRNLERNRVTEFFFSLFWSRIGPTITSER